jgi:hypothetical protein
MPPQRAHLPEETLRNNLSDALVHRFEDAAELACVNETDPTLACENRKVVTKRMDVEEKSSWPECSVDLTQDVHDVLRLNSSE